MTRVYETKTEAETRELAASLARELKSGSILLLEGDLGAGKTVFVQGLAVGLGMSADDVQSPTFGLIHQLRGNSRELLHADLYRLHPEDVLGLGLDEQLASIDVAAIEWPDRLPFALPDAIRVVIEKKGKLRKISISDSCIEGCELAGTKGS